MPDLITEIDEAIEEMRTALKEVTPEETLAIEKATLVLLKAVKQLLENDAVIRRKLWGGET